MFSKSFSCTPAAWLLNCTNVKSIWNKRFAVAFVECGVKLDASLSELRNVSLIHLPKVSFDGGLRGRKIAKTNFVINPLYGLVKFSEIFFVFFCLLCKLDVLVLLSENEH